MARDDVDRAQGGEPHAGHIDRSRHPPTVRRHRHRAGFSGLYQLYKLRDDLGLTVRVLEKADGIGGTWYWNRYPGARCDSESHYYCYSFSKEIEQEWTWTERYPEHPEIRKYLNFVADRLDLKRDIQLSTTVTSASFDDATNRWTIRTEDGATFTAAFLITAVGCLSTANVPKFKGLETFKASGTIRAPGPMRAWISPASMSGRSAPARPASRQRP